LGYLNAGAYARGVVPAETSQALTKSQWENSDWYRKGIDYQDGMTTDQAQMLAEQHDARASEAVDKALHPTASGVGSFVGSSLDPVYFLPVARWIKPFLEARMASRVMIGATEAAAQIGAGQSLQETVHYATSIAKGQGFDFPAALERIGYATLGAFAIGGAGKMFSALRGETRLTQSMKAADSVERGTQTEPGPMLSDGAVQEAIKRGVAPDLTDNAELSDLGRLAKDAQERKLAGETINPDDEVLLQSFIGDRGASYADMMAERALNGGDRRIDYFTRQRVANMTHEEMANALLTSDVTGLPNKRAFNEQPIAPYHAAVDADSLKYVNDNMGHHAGNMMLSRIAEAMNQNGLDAYHVSGDEFIIRGQDRATLERQLSATQAELKKTPITANGQEHTPQVSWGLGKSLTEADFALNNNKVARLASGERAARGERPKTSKRLQKSDQVNPQFTYWKKQAAIARAPDMQWLGHREPNPMAQQDITDILNGLSEQEKEVYNEMIEPLARESEQKAKALRLGAACRGVA